MRHIQFECLDDVIECYGRENLIALNNIKQILFYAKLGCQPCFIWEKETEAGRITCWYLKNETNYVYKKWMENHPKD